MGSKISPILVNYVLDDLVKNCLGRIPFDIPFVKRYVDDLLLAVPHNRVDFVLNVFNDFNNDIQFTVENEINNSIPFLDMLVTRNNDNILYTKWYRKPISSGRYINYHSYHIPRMKTNLVLALKHRALNLTAPQFRDESLGVLKGLLLENSYPLKFINNLLYNVHPINSQRNDLLNRRHTVGDSTGELVNQVYKSLPFIKDLTPRLVNIFRDISVVIAVRNLKTVGRLYTNTKSPISTMEKSNVVYSIPCLSCDKVYIGQTSRSLKGRITSHKSDCTRKIESCGLAQHVIHTGHKMSWSDATVLEIERNFTRRSFLEMVHINNNTNNLNKKSDIDNLSKIYTYILKLEKDKFNNIHDA